MVSMWVALGVWIACAVVGWLTFGDYGFNLGVRLGPFGLLVACIFDDDSKSLAGGDPAERANVSNELQTLVIFPREQLVNCRHVDFVDALDRVFSGELLYQLCHKLAAVAI